MVAQWEHTRTTRHGLATAHIQPAKHQSALTIVSARAAVLECMHLLGNVP